MFFVLFLMITLYIHNLLLMYIYNRSFIILFRTQNLYHPRTMKYMGTNVSKVSVMLVTASARRAAPTDYNDWLLSKWRSEILVTGPIPHPLRFNRPTRGRPSVLSWGIVLPNACIVGVPLQSGYYLVFYSIKLIYCFIKTLWSFDVMEFFYQDSYLIRIF